jgi:hypothetical protein
MKFNYIFAKNKHIQMKLVFITGLKKIEHDVKIKGLKKKLKKNLITKYVVQNYYFIRKII